MRASLSRVAGSPLKLKEELKQDVYFDQSGELSKRFGIKASPALLVQEGNQLKITENEHSWLIPQASKSAVAMGVGHRNGHRQTAPRWPKMATVTGQNLGENGQFLRKLWPF